MCLTEEKSIEPFGLMLFFYFISFHLRTLQSFKPQKLQFCMSGIHQCLIYPTAGLTEPGEALVGSLVCAYGFVAFQEADHQAVQPLSPPCLMVYGKRCVAQCLQAVIHHLDRQVQCPHEKQVAQDRLARDLAQQTSCLLKFMDIVGTAQMIFPQPAGRTAD